MPAPADMAEIDGAKAVMTARTITKKRVVCDSCCMGSDSSEDSRRTAGTYSLRSFLRTWLCPFQTDTG